MVTGYYCIGALSNFGLSLYKLTIPREVDKLNQQKQNDQSDAKQESVNHKHQRPIDNSLPQVHATRFMGDFSCVPVPAGAAALRGIFTYPYLCLGIVVTIVMTANAHGYCALMEIL